MIGQLHKTVPSGNLGLCKIVSIFGVSDDFSMFNSESVFIAHLHDSVYSSVIAEIIGT